MRLLCDRIQVAWDFHLQAGRDTLLWDTLLWDTLL